MTRPVLAKHAIRCECGKLMARWVDPRFEVKCQRCKRCHALKCPGDHHSDVPAQPV